VLIDTTFKYGSAYFVFIDIYILLPSVDNSSQTLTFLSDSVGLDRFGGVIK
jgi:hypothetical protein